LNLFNGLHSIKVFDQERKKDKIMRTMKNFLVNQIGLDQLKMEEKDVPKSSATATEFEFRRESFMRNIIPKTF
jgi:hypothetical protein